LGGFEGQPVGKRPVEEFEAGKEPPVWVVQDRLRSMDRAEKESGCLRLPLPSQGLSLAPRCSMRLATRHIFLVGAGREASGV
jgi:hypothetical protein